MAPPSRPPQRRADTAAIQNSYARILGRVVDTSGLGIPQAEVRVGSQDGMLLARSDGRGVVDAELDLEGVPGNPTDLVVLAGRFTGRILEVELRRGETVGLGRVVLAPGAEIAGFVQDEAGEPVPGAEVGWLPARAHPDRPGPARRRDVSGRMGRQVLQPSTVAAGQGSFRLRGVPLASGFVIGGGPSTEYGWTELFTVDGNGMRGVVLIVPRSASTHSIAGIVVHHDGSPAPGAFVRCSEDGGYRSTQTTNEQGRFVFHTEGGGPHRLLARSPENRLHPVEREGVLPGSTSIVLRFEELRWLDVTVTDRAGSSIPWSHVCADVRHSLGSFPLTPGGRDGVARIPLPPSTFHLTAFAPGFGRGEFGPFDPATVGERLECALDPGPTVRGRVVHRGEPVAGARVSVDSTLEPGSMSWSAGQVPGERPFAILGRTKPGGHDATTDEKGRFVTNLYADG